jgi:hypothetical protein
VADDWRLTVRLRDERDAGRLLRALHEHEVEEDVRTRLGGRIAVSGGGERLFLYADSERATRTAQPVVEEVLRDHQLRAELQLDRWHHEEERWEDASVPLPRTAAEHEAEHARLEQEEAAESRAARVAEWEVRIELASHHDARALAQRLEGEGLQPTRRWTFLLIGTADEDDAEELARRLQGELPAGATVQVEPGGGLVWQLAPANPFSIFGGLGG